MRKVPIELRFWGKVARGDPGDCWLWQGAVSNFGYGRVLVGRKNKHAHRVAYALANGVSLESLGRLQVVMHSCNTRRCCNPAHLSLGTYGENNAYAYMCGKSPPHRRDLTADEIHTALTASSARAAAATLRCGHKRIYALRRAAKEGGTQNYF